MTLSQLEPDRLESLATYGRLDKDEIAELHEIACLAARLTGAPSAMITLVEAEELVVLTSVGEVPARISRPGSYAGWVVSNHVPLVVEDGRLDPRFAEHPRVRAGHAVAFAGVPLVGRDGLPLGVLAVLSDTPTTFDVDTLGGLSTAAVNVLELHRIDLYRGSVAGSSHRGQRIRRALDRGEIETWFQPVVSLETGEPFAIEALARWRHPQRGILSASHFLPAVEHSGLSLPLGHQVLHDALRTLADLSSRLELPEVMIAGVNVSPLQLERRGFADSVLADVSAHRLAPAQLAVEVKHLGGLPHRDTALRELQSLHEAGVWVTLDDFGADANPMTTLLDLPVSAVKVDGALVRRLPECARTRSVVAMMVALAHDLGIAVVAEGIETEPQRELLQQLGCTTGQGHLFSPAIPATDLPRVLSRSVPTGAVSHTLVLDSWDDALEQALGSAGDVVLVATDETRVRLENAVARRGVSAVTRAGYSTSRSLDDVPPGATVVTDLAHALWAAGDPGAAIELEDRLGRLPARVVCLHEPWALHAHGTSQQVRRLRDQHALTPEVERDPEAHPRSLLRPDTLELIDRMSAAGVSAHSIAAALNAGGHATPWSRRWHWRQVVRVQASLG